jgi:hypothetical protein
VLPYYSMLLAFLLRTPSVLQNISQYVLVGRFTKKKNSVKLLQPLYI